MDKILTVAGMHCDACKSLIQMEIDDINLSDKVKEIGLSSDHQGFVSLQDINEEDVKQITKAINALGKYSVIN